MSLLNEIRTKLNFLSEKLANSPDELSVDERTQYAEMLRDVVHTAKDMEANLNKVTGVGSEDGATLRIVGMKLYFLSEELVNSPNELSVDERTRYSEMLRDVVHTAKGTEAYLNKVTRVESEDGATLRMVGMFPYNADRSLMLPTVEDVVQGFASTHEGKLLHVEVESICCEKNFNNLGHSVSSQNYLLEEAEVYVKFKSAEHASSVLAFSYGAKVMFNIMGRTENRIFQFLTPSQDQFTRDTYRSIGTLLKRIRVIDDRLRTIGAVPGRGGVPVLHKNLVDKWEFDETVTALVANMKESETQRACGMVGKEELHQYLVSKIKVDKKKRQSELDGLVRERIDILLKLCGFDSDVVPFSFDREFH